MSQKGQQKIFDEFAWIIIAAVGFVLVITMVFTATTSAPVVEPRSLSLTLEKGTSHTFAITVRSEDGKKISNVTLSSFGEVKDWITFDKNKFDAENSTSVRVKVQIPKTATLRTYAGGIKAETRGGSSSLSLSIAVANVSIIPIESRPIFLGDVEVKYAKGSETLSSKENLEVIKGGFSESKEAFSIPVPAEKLAITTSAHLELFVVDTNKRGNLIVEFNGQELYNKKTDVGKVVIPLDKSLLNTTNIVSIRTTGPSVFQFWSKAVYRIEKANFAINFRDISERERTFELSQNEIQNFHHFQLQARVKEYSAPLEELFIKVNNQIVYAAKPPIVSFNQAIEKDILGNRLVLENQNRISFSFEKEASLNLDDVFLVVYFS
ncbi:MAG: hypothetical protein AABW61_02095 [Candidatus Aenigmatarchaeota archaeon]